MTVSYSVFGAIADISIEYSLAIAEILSRFNQTNFCLRTAYRVGYNKAFIDYSSESHLLKVFRADCISKNLATLDNPFIEDSKSLTFVNTDLQDVLDIAKAHSNFLNEETLKKKYKPFLCGIYALLGSDLKSQASFLLRTPKEIDSSTDYIGRIASTYKIPTFILTGAVEADIDLCSDIYNIYSCP